MSEHHRTSEWAATVRVMRPRLKAQVDAGRAVCIDCHRPIQPGQRWQVGHVVSVAIAKQQGWTTAQINAASNLGPSHTKSRGQKACNQIAGGKLGAAISNAPHREAKRLPDWL